MLSLKRVPAIVDVFAVFEANEATFEEAISFLSGIIAENLKEFGVMSNSQNAAQIANLLTADLYPEDPLGELIHVAIVNGRLPNFSNNCESTGALMQGCAVLATNLSECYDTWAPKAAASRLFKMIEGSGLLPQESVTE